MARRGRKSRKNQKNRAWQVTNTRLLTFFCIVGQRLAKNLFPYKRTELDLFLFSCQRHKYSHDRWIKRQIDREKISLSLSGVCRCAGLMMAVLAGVPVHRFSPDGSVDEGRVSSDSPQRMSSTVFVTSDVWAARVLHVCGEIMVNFCHQRVENHLLC